MALHHDPALRNVIERRKAFADNKFFNVTKKFTCYNFPHKQVFPEKPFQCPSEKFRYQTPKYRKFWDDRPNMNHPYYGPERFSMPLDVLRMSMEMPPMPFPDTFPGNFRRPYKFRKNKFPPKNGQFQGNFHAEKKNKKFFTKEEPPKENRPSVNPEEDNNIEESIENVKFDTEISESCVLNYCLDRDTQHTINRIQNDFRLTDKYKSFIMFEMPSLADFKPTPITTTHKLHDRFKCLFKQLLDENDLNIDLDLELEKSVDTQSIPETVVTSEPTNT